MNYTTTQVGYCGITETRFFGYSVFDELVKNETLLGMTALALLKRRLQKEERKILEHLTVLLTAADPRIWPLKITRLVAASGSAESGILAGQASLRGSVVGPETVRQAALFLMKVDKGCNKKRDALDIKRSADAIISSATWVPGFGVPGRPFDQRLVILDALIKKKGRHTLPYYRIKQEVVRVFQSKHPKTSPNIAIGVAALCLDIGFHPNDMAPLFYLLLFNPIAANAVESSKQSTPEWKRLPDDSIRYIGRPPRQSPRKQGSGGGYRESI